LLDLLLDAVEPGSLPVPGTELAPSLTRALDLFAETRREHRVMVLLTDGEDHGGRLQATLDRLRREGVAVHAIGVGTPQGAPVPLPDDPRRRDADAPGYKRDGDGQVVISRLGETVLEEIAAATGGVYVRATSAAADVEPIERHIRDMATRTLESETVSTLEERFQWPLAAAALLVALQLALGAFRAGARRAAPAARGSAP
jgi:Ca-activated chloride channel family protein